MEELEEFGAIVKVILRMNKRRVRGRRLQKYFEKRCLRKEKYSNENSFDKIKDRLQQSWSAGRRLCDWLGERLRGTESENIPIIPASNMIKTFDFLSNILTQASLSWRGVFEKIVLEEEGVSPKVRGKIRRRRGTRRRIRTKRITRRRRRRRSSSKVRTLEGLETLRTTVLRSATELKVGARGLRNFRKYTVKTPPPPSPPPPPPS
ncbi:hypothetical protein V1478_001012 [Vespula squamosa]|uniref:Uncharacterized protein n=1 Tax=Vespula squamosa TaxID=30214 RepID=A0ABD2C739_VESSQ